MRVMTKWALLLGLSALSLWAVGQMTVTAELYPWIADNGVVVWQELLWDPSKPRSILNPRRTDLFQVPVSLLPDPNVGIRAVQINPPTDLFVLPNPLTFSRFAGRPQVSADGRWLVYYDQSGQVYVKDLTITDPADPNYPPKRISYKNWSDTDNDGIRDGDQTPSEIAILPAISGSGRIVAFLSRDPDLNDPQGDGNGPSAQAPPLGRWLIYIHDRDADGNGTLDEAKVGGTTTRFLPDQTGNTPLFVTLTEVRLSLDQTGRSLAFSTWTGTQWQLWFVPDVQNPSPQQIATSSSPFSIPSVAGSRLAFTASGPFSSSFPNDGPGIYVVDTNTNQTVAIQTNGVNGAPVLSRDGTLLAFHSTMTGFRVNGGQWQPLPNKRNAVDDVFVFDLTGLPVWSTLVLRQANPAQFPPYAPCVNPALPSSSANLIAFQEIVNGASRVRVVNLPNIVLR
jgi:Tol biopolymer transport system component